jgi:hypothetical protein
VSPEARTEIEHVAEEMNQTLPPDQRVTVEVRDGIDQSVLLD